MKQKEYAEKIRKEALQKVQKSSPDLTGASVLAKRKGELPNPPHSGKERNTRLPSLAQTENDQLTRRERVMRFNQIKQYSTSIKKPQPRSKSLPDFVPSSLNLPPISSKILTAPPSPTVDLQKMEWEHEKNSKAVDEIRKIYRQL
jgi:hypothetical protein